MKEELGSLLEKFKNAPLAEVPAKSREIQKWFTINKTELQNMGIGVAGAVGSAAFSVYELSSHHVLAAVSWMQWLAVVAACVQFGLACYQLATAATTYRETSQQLSYWNEVLDKCQQDVSSLQNDYERFVGFVMQLGKGNMDHDGVLTAYETLSDQVSRALQIRRGLAHIKDQICQHQARSRGHVVASAASGSTNLATAIGCGIGIAVCSNPVGLAILITVTSVSGAATLVSGAAGGVAAANLSRLNEAEARLLDLVAELNQLSDKIEQLREVVKSRHHRHQKMRIQLVEQADQLKQEQQRALERQQQMEDEKALLLRELERLKA